MAKGQLLTMSSLQGSIGGLSFKKGKGASIMYAKKAVLTCNSAPVTRRRSLAVYASTNWRFIGESARKAWKDIHYAGKSGFHLYMYCMLNRSIVTTIAIVRPSRPVSQPAINALSMSANVTGVVNVTISFVPTATLLYGIEIQCTNPVSVGTDHLTESRYKTVAVIPTVSSNTFDISTGYLSVFGSTGTISGSKVFCRIRTISRGTGYASPWVYTNTIVT